MQKKIQHIRIVLSLTFYLFFLWILFPNPSTVADSIPQDKHILFLNAFTQDYPVHDLYNSGVKSILNRNADYAFGYSYEYLDMGRHSQEEGYPDTVATYLKGKYSLHKEPDFIVTAIDLYPFMEQYGKDIFPNVPLIISWSEDNLPAHSTLPQDYQADLRYAEIDKNIALILQTRPLTKKIYMVIGDSPEERITAGHIQATLTKYQDQTEIILLNKLPYTRMLDQLKQAGEDSAVLYFKWVADVNGESFIPAQVIATICRETKAPVYGSGIQYLGRGVVGGYVSNYEDLGKTVGKEILNQLTGAKPAVQQLILPAPSSYVFDWRQLQRWHIKEKTLPNGSRVEFRQYSAWELYSGYIIGGIILFSLQAILIFILLINHRRRKRAETELVRTNTSLQAMTGKLIGLNQEKDEFLTLTAHELKTPIHGIQNMTEATLKQSETALSPKQKENLDLVLAIAKRLASLVNDLLDLTRLKHRELKLNLVPVNLNGCVDNVLQVFNHLISQKKIKLVNWISPSMPPVYADESRLRQILYNLIGNAVKFTQEGSVTLTADQKDDRLYVSVQDTGIGIPQERKEDIFNAYEQSVAEVSEEYGGMGIGLSITKQLIEQMNGEILLEWSEEGQGSIFTFYLPLAENRFVESLVQDEDNNQALSDEPSPSLTVPAAATADKAEFRILVVDDEAVNIRVMENVFAHDNFEMSYAFSGTDALALIEEKGRFDIVLLDVMMPRMSGFEVCRLIRERFSRIDLPVILITVRNSPEDIFLGFKAGANDYISKPFSAQELRARVRIYLELKKLLAQAITNEIAFLQAQIKPHFLYNALSGIISLCYTDSRQAGKLLTYLSNYLHRCFDFGNKKTYIPIRTEMELVGCYVEIEKARFGDDLQIELAIDDGALGYQILPFAIQPLVENAIRHGVMVREEGGTVRISVQKREQIIDVAIEDDGVGMSQDKIDKLLLNKKNNHPTEDNKATGLGLYNIHERLLKFYGESIHIQSGEGHGTKVSFAIPAREIQ